MNRIVESRELKDGMKVLFADPGYEDHLESFIGDHSEPLSSGALGYCYWAKITHVIFSRNKQSVSFATFDNVGIPTNRQYPIETRWIIKVDSDAMKRQKVLEVVTEAIKAAEVSTYLLDPTSDELTPEYVVKRIYKILGLEN